MNEHSSGPKSFRKISTAAVKNDLEQTTSLGEFLKKNEDKMLTRHLSKHLNKLLMKKNIICADVVRDSGEDKAYVYQIFNGKKHPSRDKLISIIFGLHLNEEDAQRTLKLAGYSELYPRVARDAVILFAIKRGMSVWETDDALYDNGFPTLHT